MASSVRILTGLVAILQGLVLISSAGGQKFDYYDAFAQYVAEQQELLDIGKFLEKQIEARRLKDRLPALTPSQQQFAVNPAFKSFYDARFKLDPREEKDTEEVSGEEAAEENSSEEVAVPEAAAAAGIDAAHDKHKNPKKASTEALTRDRGDPVFTSMNYGNHKTDDIYFTTIVAVSSALAVFAVVGLGFCYHRIQRNAKAAEDVEYPAYGVTGPGGKESSPTSGGGGSSGDRKLAQSAQMYHYQHQKQQMIAFDSNNGTPTAGAVNGAKVGGSAIPDRRNGTLGGSDCESDDDGEEADYTVYECPGLAPTGEMEVRNPLFQDDPTPKAKEPEEAGGGE